jgi:hypothetical protein
MMMIYLLNGDRLMMIWEEVVSDRGQGADYICMDLRTNSRKGKRVMLPRGGNLVLQRSMSVNCIPSSGWCGASIVHGDETQEIDEEIILGPDKGRGKRM